MPSLPFHQWVVLYLCGAVVAAGSALVFAARARKRDDPAAPALAGGPALLAGALWPVVVAGLVQWFVIHLVATWLEPPRLHRAALIRYGSRPVRSAGRSNAA
ncbi:hypothetical protein ACXDF8_00935 [Mycolicibacterium sp. CBM1]